MTAVKNRIVILSVLFLTIMMSACTKDETTKSSTSSTSKYKGTWVRDLGASGDETDIAIGNISGEPSNRVYMCEWKGTVGLYKGTISGDIITWDDVYGMPYTKLGLENGKLTFEYPTLSYTLLTYYSSGVWTSHCGPLSSANTGGGTGGGSGSGTGTGEVVFWTSSDHGCGPIEVTINGLSGTITKYYASSTPTCGAVGCATFTLSPGTYSYSATCGTYTWGKTGTKITVTANSCYTMQLK